MTTTRHQDDALLLEESDVARTLRVSRARVRRLIAAGELEPTLTLASGREVYSRPDVDALRRRIEQRQV